MNHALQLLLLLLLHRLTLPAAAGPPIIFHSAACSDKLVTFSTCLPFVAVAPNNLTDSPPPQCCEEVSAAFGDGSAICLCYFFRRPDILGFPLNSTKLLSLTSVCPLKDQTSKANFSLNTLCSRSAALPPLHSITGPRNPTLPNFGAENSPPPPPLMGSTEEPSGSSSTEDPPDESPSQPSLSIIPTTISTAATQRMYRLNWIWLCFLVYIFTSL